MQANHRDLNGKAREKGPEEPGLQRWAVVGAAQGLDIEGMAALHEKDNDRNQQQKAAGEGEEKELDRGIDAVRSAPDPDDQVHGNQHHFPEDIEQDNV